MTALCLVLLFWPAQTGQTEEESLILLQLRGARPHCLTSGNEILTGALEATSGAPEVTGRLEYAGLAADGVRFQLDSHGIQLSTRNYYGEDKHLNAGLEVQGELPPGKYPVDARVVDASGRELACSRVELAVSAPRELSTSLIEARRAGEGRREIGRASCRERV